MIEELTGSITLKKGDEVFLDNVSLRLNRGEAMALYGENVSLKRLFLKIIASQKKDLVLLIEDDTILADIISANSERYILRTSVLFGAFDVTEYLEYKFSHLQASRTQKLNIIKDRLSRFGLERRSHTKLKNLSLEEAALLNIAAQSTTQKKVIIIDADSFLDASVKPFLERAVIALKSLGYTVLLSVCVKELSECAGVDRIGVIENGKIIELTPPKKTYASQKSVLNSSLIDKIKRFFLKFIGSSKKRIGD
ncbi:MAG TPA: ATP-binding cassette domain-containing protein [Clostridia bacterium]